MKTCVLLLDENRGFGGAERHVLSLARELEGRGLLASVVARKDSWLFKEGSRSLPFSPCGFRNEVDMFSVFSIYKMVKSTGANVLHCIAHRDLVAAALARQLPGAPKLVLLKAEHSFPDNDLSPLFRWAYRQCDGIASVSQAMQTALQEKLRSETPWECRFEVVPNGIETPTGATAAPTPSSDGRLRVGILSALHPGKGQRDVLEALAGADPGLRERVHLSIAGDGPLKAELQSLSQQLGLAVEFHGHHSDPVSFLGSLDLCLLPSHTETFSLVALESLTLGVPLLAADSQGVSEIYTEREMIYPKGDRQALLTKLEAFMAQPEVFRAAATELSARYRAQYSRESMGTNYQRLYETLLTQQAVS